MKEKKNEEVIIGLKHDKDKVSPNKTIILEPKKNNLVCTTIIFSKDMRNNESQILS